MATRTREEKKQARLAEAARRKRNAEWWALYQQGVPQTEIAKRYGVKQPAVSRGIKDHQNADAPPVVVKDYVERWRRGITDLIEAHEDKKGDVEHAKVLIKAWDQYAIAHGVKSQDVVPLELVREMLALISSIVQEELGEAGRQRINAAAEALMKAARKEKRR